MALLKFYVQNYNFVQISFYFIIIIFLSNKIAICENYPKIEVFNPNDETIQVFPDANSNSFKFKKTYDDFDFVNFKKNPVNEFSRLAEKNYNKFDVYDFDKKYLGDKTINAKSFQEIMGKKTQSQHLLTNNAINESPNPTELIKVSDTLFWNEEQLAAYCEENINEFFNELNRSPNIEPKLIALKKIQEETHVGDWSNNRELYEAIAGLYRYSAAAINDISYKENFMTYLTVMDIYISLAQKGNLAIINDVLLNSDIYNGVYNIELREYSKLKETLAYSFIPILSQRLKNKIIILFLALIYPIFWIFYLLLPRFYRLDTTRDVYSFISTINPEIIVACFFSCYMLLPVILSFNEKFKKLKEFLWEYTKALCYTLHLKFLKYFIYFKFCEWLYKAFFIFHDIFAGNDGATWNFLKRWDTFTQKILWFLYFGKGKITFYIFVFAFILGEIILMNGKLHLGLYFLFFSPLIVSFFTNLIAYGDTNFVLDVCISDYKTQNFFNPRYPRKFWTYMQAPEEYFGFAYQMSREEYDALMKTLILEIAIKKASDIFYHQNIRFRSWGIRHVNYKKIKTSLGDYTIPSYFKYTGEKKSWSFRLAAKYKKNYGIRWFSTTLILKYPLPENLHPRTISFLGNHIYALLAISNHPSIKYNDLQKIAITKKFPSPYELYSPYDTNAIRLEKTETNLVETFESNFVMRFKSLVKNGVIIGTYGKMKEIINYNKMECLQMRPDMISIWETPYFVFKGILGIDQKHKRPTLFGRNQVISRPVENYNKLLDDYQTKLEKEFPKYANQEIFTILEHLKKSQNDPEEHIKIWAESLHIFPEKWKPPLLLEKTFDESHLNERALELLRKGEAFIVHVSDTLYTLEKTQENSGSFDNLALDYFENSFIQKCLNEDKECFNSFPKDNSLEVD